MIKQDNFTFTSKDGSEIYTYKWFDEEIKPRAAIQIAHGMAERAGRYEEFAHALVKTGCIVYANDHRGHGNNATDLKDLGYLGDEKGFKYLVDDMARLTDIIRKDNPDIPLILFGHSMGSFAAQRYIMDYKKDIQGLILSGSNGDHGSVLKLAKTIALAEKKLRGNRAQSKLLHKLSFGTYNRNFAPTRTEFDWLSRDEKEVDKYVNDPYCGTVFPASFYYEFFDSLLYVENKDNFSKIPKNLPILIISGDQDPVGFFGKGVENLYRRYMGLGLGKVKYKLYEGARHELLKGPNRKRVIADIIDWIDSTI